MILGKNYWCADSSGLQVCKSAVCKCRTPFFSSIRFLAKQRFLSYVSILYPTNAVLSQTNSIQCLLCAEFLETSDSIAVSGRSGVCEELATTFQVVNITDFQRGLAICLQKSTTQS